jgi:2-amino-4-hydroxy-6-hydroxymethyldihydropteridine diphosphokinase
MLQSYWFHHHQQQQKEEKTYNPYFYSMPVHKVYILLGSNVGKRKSFLNNAIKHIKTQCGTVVKSSSVYETAAWGNTEQQSFLNQIIILQTRLSPDELMQKLLQIENLLGRVRTEKYAPRTIDLDILFYNGLIYKSKQVTVPHPAIAERRFVLVPLAELSPRKQHPVYKKTVSTLLKECTDGLNVKKYKR